MHLRILTAGSLAALMLVGGTGAFALRNYEEQQRPFGPPRAGFFVATDGTVLTTQTAVEDCARKGGKLEVKAGPVAEIAEPIFSDHQNNIALLRPRFGGVAESVVLPWVDTPRGAPLNIRHVYNTVAGDADLAAILSISGSFLGLKLADRTMLARELQALLGPKFLLKRASARMPAEIPAELDRIARYTTTDVTCIEVPRDPVDGPAVADWGRWIGSKVPQSEPRLLMNPTARPHRYEVTTSAAVGMPPEMPKPTLARPRGEKFFRHYLEGDATHGILHGLTSEQCRGAVFGLGYPYVAEFVPPSGEEKSQCGVFLGAKPLPEDPRVEDRSAKTVFVAPAPSGKLRKADAAN